MSEHGDWHDDWRNNWDRTTEDALRSGDLATLRPEPMVLGDEWMDRSLAAILESGAPPARRKWKRLAAGATVVVLATGGVAAATGTAPDFVRQAMGRPAGHDATPFRPAVTLYADVRVPGGGRFAAWRGEGQGYECRAVAHNWNGREQSSGHGSSCGRVPPASDPDREEQRFDYSFSSNARQTIFYPVVYGIPAEPAATQVRVRGELWGGEDFQRLVPLDPVSHGFGVVVPGERSIASLRREWDTPPGQPSYWDSRLRSVVLEVLDAQGEVLRTVPLLHTRQRGLDPTLTSYDDLGR